MTTVKILGPGCDNCKRLAWLVERTAQHLGLEITIIKVTDYPEIMKYNVMSTPGLVINEKVVCSGRIPRQEEITAFLQGALQTT
jgi:small redox-active disulfide protein 2